MSMDSTVQIRLDGELKAKVESLYRSLGTPFAETMRIFAQQSLMAGVMPFRANLKSWAELTREEINEKLSKSEADIDAGRVCSQEELNSLMRERFSSEQHKAI